MSSLEGSFDVLRNQRDVIEHRVATLEATLEQRIATTDAGLQLLMRRFTS